MKSDPTFWARYNTWEAEAREQAREAVRQAGFDPDAGHLEVCEDGSVYRGNLTWFPAGTVTPWEKSTHYAG